MSNNTRPGGTNPSVGAEKKNIVNLTEGSILKSLLVFSWPLILSNLLQMVYNMVDMVIVGRYVGSVGLSAVSCASDITMLVTSVCIGFTSAGQVLISQQVGKGSRMLSKAVGNITTFFTILALLTSLLGLLLTDVLLEAINVPAEAAEQAREYCIVCFWGMAFSFGYNAVSAILRGMGDSLRPLIFIAIAAVSNLILDILFVAGLGWGPKGAAIATVMGQAVSFLISLAYLARQQKKFDLDMHRADFLPDRTLFSVIFKMGLPMALQGSAVLLSKLFVHSYINAYGLVISALSGVGTKIGQCANVISSAMSTAGTSLVGQNFGAGKLDRIRRTVFICLGISLTFCWSMGLVILLLPEWVFGLFSQDPQVLALAPTYSVILALVFSGAAFRTPATALINGQGNAKLALVVGILDGIVARIGFAILLGQWFGMGVMGFWLGDVIASHVPVVIGGVYYFSGAWKRFRLPAAEIDV